MKLYLYTGMALFFLSLPIAIAFYGLTHSWDIEDILSGMSWCFVISGLSFYKAYPYLKKELQKGPTDLDKKLSKMMQNRRPEIAFIASFLFLSIFLFTSNLVERTEPTRNSITQSIPN